MSTEKRICNKSQLLLEMNPVHKKIPVLIHNGNPICESSIIVEYIDEVWNDKSPLLPSDPDERAQARFWADYITKKVTDVGRRIWLRKGEEREAEKKEMIEILKQLESQLGENPFFGGDRFGLGDFSVEEHCPKMIWLQKQSVSKSLVDPKKVYDFAMAFKN